MGPCGFHPLVEEWFRRHFGEPTEPQLRGWPEIRAGRDVLISAPTGSGKTLASFLIAIDRLVSPVLTDETQIVYVSPLKALSNDVHKNLEIPLAGISALARSQGVELAPIRAALRTGDTAAWERQQMLARPPHIVVTTPESLFILLTTEKGRRMLSTARTVIVDEIHAVADDKRGSHLALTLARLDALLEQHGRPWPQRVGLSATVKPLEEVARWLSPTARVIHVARRRAMELAVEVPRDELSSVASNEMWDEVYDRLAELIRQYRTTLVFVNTRRLSERVAHHLGERLGHEAVLPHHGSLSRKLRLTAEEKLKKGELSAVVATASLELGIDIGSVDLVCQMGSPRSLSVALQRIGRSGHWVGAQSRGRIFATTRDELIECAALVRAIRAGELDRLEIPENSLDVLAQQIVAETAARDWPEEDLFTLVRRAYPYRNLERRDFDAVITMLSEGIATSRGRASALIHHDRIQGRLRGRRGARLAAITSGGAIPDNANFAVIAEPEGATIGTVDEDFATESMAGDVFLLGTTSWRIRKIEPGRVRVEDAQGAAPGIPFWRGEAPGRTAELSLAVSELREEVARREDAVGFLMEECSLDRRGAEQAEEYVRAGKAALGALPSQKLIVAERFFDEGGGMQLVLHAPFGSRINRAWGLALRKRFCRSFNLELQAAATDDGILISLTEQHAFPLEIVFEFLKPATVKEVLTQALLDSPMFAVRWRWNVSRALAILRFAGGRKIPAPLQRMRSDDLLAAVFPDQAACFENLVGDIRIPDHPLVNETIANCLYEAMDLPGLQAVLEGIRSGRIGTAAIDTPEPSPFSHEMVNANPFAFLDDAPLEERRARAVQMRRSLTPDLAQGTGALDAAAIQRVAEEAWPDPRDADELHDALLTLVLVPPEPVWQAWFDELATVGRARVVDGFWVATERLELLRDIEKAAPQILRGWMESVTPVRVSELAARLRLAPDVLETAMLQLENEGQVLRGYFTPGQSGEIEWSNRRLLARIHRLTLHRLRSEIEPVATGEFMRFLYRWQHVAPGTQLHDVDGALEVIRQLEGYEIPAGAWESEILPRRVAQYSPELLDRLCLSGEVMWGRLSPHPAFEQDDGARRRVRPTRVAPISIFLRENAEWLLGRRRNGADENVLSHPARELLSALQKRGASFFAELQSATHRLPAEVEDGLWELVAAGLVTADGFENLRALTDPKRRRGEGRGRHARPRHAAGRWALLPSPEHPESAVNAGMASLLLRRWGVVFRALVAHETLAPPWRDLLVVLRRMEAQGEIRGGRFVAGFSGEQYALPEAIEALRAVRRSGVDGKEPEVSPADPLQLSGIITPASGQFAVATLE